MDKIKANKDLHAAITAWFRRAAAYNNFVLDSGRFNDLLKADRQFFAEIAHNPYAGLCLSHMPIAVVNYVDAVSKVSGEAANRNELVSIALFGIIEAATQVVFRVMPDENILDLRRALSQFFEEVVDVISIV